MENLFDGVKEFNSNDFLEHKDLFAELGKKQNPHTLFIGCSDSRLVPNLITKTLPGELFVIRNIANIVPYYRVSQEFAATTSAIEYAIKILNVENILICGHSNCGGCNAMFFDEQQFSEIPNTKKWLELSNLVKQKIYNIPEIHSDHAKREWMTEQLNIVEQMKHLLTYPFIKERFKKNELKILGWYYIIETGEIFNYSTESKQFEKIE